MSSKVLLFWWRISAMVAISSSLFLVSALERPMDLREGNFKEEPAGFLPVRFLRDFFWEFPFGLNHSHGRDEEESLEGGVGLVVEILSVPKQPCTLGGEQRAGLLLREELEREEMMLVRMRMKMLTCW